MSEPSDEQVLHSVPHRPPILRVHRVVANDGVAAHVLGREPAGPGALPWPVGAIEGLAQSAAVLLAHGAHAAVDRKPGRGMLVAVQRFTAGADPAPEAEISYHVRLLRRLGATAKVAGHAEASGVTLAAGELTIWTAPA